jgi:hypothetical protein
MYGYPHGCNGWIVAVVEGGMGDFWIINGYMTKGYSEVSSELQFLLVGVSSFLSVAIRRLHFSNSYAYTFSHIQHYPHLLWILAAIATMSWPGPC